MSRALSQSSIAPLSSSGRARPWVARPGPAPAPSRWIRLVDTLVLWQERFRSRQTLAGMDDRMLRDVGLSRADLEPEIRKPVWRP